MENRKTSRVTERRTSMRVPVQLPVTLRYRGRLIPATACNLSCGGMMLDTPDAAFMEEDHLELIFDLSTIERDVTLRGAIIRNEAAGRNHRIGIQFTNVCSIGHEAVTRFLKRQGKSEQH